MNLSLASCIVLVVGLLLGCAVPSVEPKSYKATGGRSGTGISLGGSQNSGGGAVAGAGAATAGSGNGNASAGSSGPGGGTGRGGGLGAGGGGGGGGLSGGGSSRLSGGGSSLGGSGRGSAEHQLNIGLLVPHTNFGRRDGAPSSPS
ncbi:uncharacterized protein LOC131291000 [Anopheles ziemanni]|uniref:uncharacterized protein LOC131291000 n=1 Tax=Anopheles ziemanni TaxID=345580 RepID=UPI0026601B3B|nr:uncharacterized protein LOC131291000 [Anopheles ziemanni]